MSGPSIVPNARWFRGLRAALIEGRTDCCTLVSAGGVFTFLYEELEGLWRTGVSWLCKNTEGWLTAPFGWGGARLPHIWLWFVYVRCQWSPPPGKSLSLKTCTCLCQSHKIKWVCDAGVWLCTSCSCSWMVLIEVFTETTLLTSRVLSVFYVKRLSEFLIHRSVSVSVTLWSLIQISPCL